MTRKRRIITAILLVTAAVLLCGWSCEGGEYCDAGQHYEWRDIGSTTVAVCVE